MSGKAAIVVYRRTKKRNTEQFVETNGIDWVRIYHDDIDGGFDYELSAGMAKELFSKLKKQWNEQRKTTKHL